MARRLKLSRFRAEERGTVAILFGLIVIVFTFAAGMGIDMSRIVHTKSRLSAAIDAAAIAAGRALIEGRLTDGEIVAMAERYVDENIKGGGELFGKVETLDVKLDRNINRVQIDVTAEVPMTLTAVAGFTSIDLPVHAVADFDQKDIELAMALDVTGSMGGSKIADLKLAAKDLIDILLPDVPGENKVRVALAPYAAGVNAGSYASKVTNGRSTKCVHERGGAEAFTDAPAEKGTYLGYKKDMECPSARVRPLTDKKAVLKADIDAYTAGGATAGHLGAAWAWYLLSPRWSALWPGDSTPEAYKDPKILKAAILMTDGEFNTQYVDATGSSGTQARQVCAQMKAAGVVVYAVAFMSPPAAEALLKDCASSGAHFFSASAGSDLRAAFQQIAISINNLRLTN